MSSQSMLLATTTHNQPKIELNRQQRRRRLRSSPLLVNGNPRNTASITDSSTGDGNLITLSGSDCSRHRATPNGPVRCPSIKSGHHSSRSNYLLSSARQPAATSNTETTVTNRPTIVDNRPTKITLLSTCTNQFGSMVRVTFIGLLLSSTAILMKIKAILMLQSSFICTHLHSLINNNNNNDNRSNFRSCKFVNQLFLAPFGDIPLRQVCKQILIKLNDILLLAVNKENIKNKKCHNSNYSKNSNNASDNYSEDDRHSNQLTTPCDSPTQIGQVQVAQWPQSDNPKRQSDGSNSFTMGCSSKRQRSSAHLLPTLFVLFALMFSRYNCHLTQISSHHHNQQQQLSQSVATLFDEIEQQEENIDNNNNNLVEDDTAEISNNNLPMCLDDKTICGYMQINSVGFNRVPMCNCKGRNGPVACPMTWNLLDRAVKHGNDFYKYCNRKPRLAPCHDRQIAYTTFGKSDMNTFEKLLDVQRMLCLCPSNYILKSNQTMFKETDSSYIYGTEFLCQKKPRCGRRQICLSITETSETTLEKQHCRCSAGKICPRDVRQAYEKHRTDRGALFNMRCI